MIQIQRLSFVLLYLAAFGCGSSTSPSGRDSLTITGPTPATGSNITLPAQLTAGWKTSVTVSGFQVFRVPCDVTGFRAMWHMRNNGNLQPPSASETIADNSFSAMLHLLR